MLSGLVEIWGVVVFLFDCWISQVFDEVQEVRYIADIPTLQIQYFVSLMFKAPDSFIITITILKMSKFQY